MQLGFHAHELLGFSLSELEHRNAGGLRDHFGNHILVHDHLHVGFAFTPGRFLLLALSFQLLLPVAQLGRLLEVLVLDGLILLFGQLGHLRIKLLELRRGGQTADTQARTGLIDQIDGLIGQMTVLNVTRRQLRCGLQRAIGDRHMMVILVAFTQTLQDLDGFGDGRLMHLNRLETAFQRRILFDVLAVLVGGGGADGLQFAASQHGLKHVGSAQGTIRGTCAHDGMDLVDEQHDVTTGLDLFQDLLQAFLEIATIA